jgi:hypothetical protein
MSPPNPDARRTAPPRFQFSLARLMVAVTAIALLLGFSSTIGSTIAFFNSIVLYILASGLVAFAVYSRGDLQAFAIGALVPCLPLMVGPFHSTGIASGLGYLVRLLLFSGICGAVATIARRWIVENQRD